MTLRPTPEKREKRDITSVICVHKRMEDQRGIPMHLLTVSQSISHTPRSAWTDMA